MSITINMYITGESAYHWDDFFLPNEYYPKKYFFYILVDLLMIFMLCYSSFSDIWK